MIEFVYPHTQLVAGVDEVGRGPLVGAVVTAAVILDPARPIAGLNDSKKLSEKRRLALCEEIKEKALSWSLGRAEPHEIDELNILHATMLAMQRAVAGLHIAPEYVLIDGNRCPKLPMPSMAVVKGDSRVPEISAASILAKVTRDEMCIRDRNRSFRNSATMPSIINLSANERRLLPQVRLQTSFLLSLPTGWFLLLVCLAYVRWLAK